MTTTFVEKAAGTYLMACDRIEALQRRAETWPECEEFLDEAVSDLQWAGEEIAWAQLMDNIEALPLDIDERIDVSQIAVYDIPQAMFEEFCCTEVV